jgi:ammonia channel protein AmtB
VQDDEGKIEEKFDTPSSTTPTTPLYYRVLSYLTTSFIINSLSILTLFALIWFIFGFFIAFEKKHSFMQEAIVIPRRIVNNGIKTSCKYFNLEKACKDGLDKFFWKWFE